MSLVHEKFKKIYFDNYQSLCNLAYKYLADRDASQDVVQEVMVRFWEIKTDLFDHPNNAKYYLFSAIRNRCLSELRKKTYETVDVDNIDVVQEEAKQEDRPLDVETLMNLAFEDIPPKCLEIFKLSRLEKLSYQQIADRLQLSVKTVENQMGKALAHIRSFVKKNPELFVYLIFVLKIGVFEIATFS